ncbi:MAG: tRNA (guanosine(37)-N1)-methyltransferase TrmD [Pseudomonadota bacterium]
MQISVVTLFPTEVGRLATYGVVGRALDQGVAQLSCVNPRDFAEDVHRTVDDRPYGGGPGMVMTVPPLREAIAAARANSGGPVIHLSPAGRRFDQVEAGRLAGLEHFVLVAGRYEGIDERLVERDIDEELSLGDFVLSGGEIAAMAVIDAVVRLLPGALGDSESAAQDSFMNGLLDHPHYSRPEAVDDQVVPDVLLSGDHAKIARWREMQSLGRTWQRRPDLLEIQELTAAQQALLDEYIANHGDEPDNQA